MMGKSPDVESKLALLLTERQNRQKMILSASKVKLSSAHSRTSNFVACETVRPPRFCLFGAGEFLEL